jgi:hypothetical protein
LSCTVLNRRTPLGEGLQSPLCLAFRVLDLSISPHVDTDDAYPFVSGFA